MTMWELLMINIFQAYPLLEFVAIKDIRLYIQKFNIYWKLNTTIEFSIASPGPSSNHQYSIVKECIPLPPGDNVNITFINSELLPRDWINKYTFSTISYSIFIFFKILKIRCIFRKFNIPVESRACYRCLNLTLLMIYEILI